MKKSVDILRNICYIINASGKKRCKRDKKFFEN